LKSCYSDFWGIVGSGAKTALVGNGIPIAERHVNAAVSPIEACFSAKQSGMEAQPSLKKKALFDEQSLKPRQNNLGRVFQQSKKASNPSYPTI
jgi:hypothetical protein